MKSKLYYYLEMGRRVNLVKAWPKIWNYVKYRKLKKKAVLSLGDYTPQIASLWMTRRCNLKCSYCSAGNILYKEKEKWIKSEATLKTVKKIFENRLFDNCLLVDLQGGEPLLVKNIKSIVAYLVKRGHIVNMSTNGVLLLRYIRSLKDAGISRINVSIYEANRSVLERNLGKINKIFPVHASIVLMRRHIEKDPEEIIERVRFVFESGCRSVRFWMYRPVGTNPMKEEVINDRMPAYTAFKKRLDKEFPGFCFWPALIQAKITKKLCPQLWQRVGTDMEGNMAICCGIEKMLSGQDSNLFKSDPSDLANNPILVNMRRQLLDTKKGPPNVCKTCTLLSESGW